MRIVIDHELCTGHGRCFDLAAEVFVDDENGYGQLREGIALSAELESSAPRAVRSCPEGAISMDDDDI